MRSPAPAPARSAPAPPSTPLPPRGGAGEEGDPDLDRLTALVARALGAPAAVVTVLGPTHQYFRGQCGLRGPLASERRTPLRRSLCREVVALGEPLVLDDTAADPHFATHPAVTELSIGAYLGVPLRDAAGGVGGTLSVLDWGPHVWTQEDRLVLRDYAALAERLLFAESSARHLRTIFDASFQLMGLMRPDGTLLELNRPALALAGVRAEDVLGRPAWEGPWWRSEHDRAAFREAVRRAAAGELIRYDVEIQGPGGVLPIDLSIKPVYEGERVVALIPEGRPLSETVRALHMQEALHAGRVGTWTVDFESDAVQRSGSTDTIFGFPDDGAPRFLDAYLARMHPEDATAARQDVLAAVYAGTPFTTRVRVLLPEGEVRHVVARGEGILGPDGRPLRVTGALTDVSEREEAQAALARSEELRRVALDAVGMGTWAWDPVSGALELDDRERALLALAPGAGIEDFLARVHPEDVSAVREALRRMAEEGEDHEHDFRYRQLAGGYRWLAVKGRFLSGVREAGTVVGVTIDVTEQREAREAARESEERFRQIAEAIPQIVFIAGPGGEIEYLNEQWYAYTGRARDGDGDALWEVLHPEDRHVLEGVWAELRALGHPLDMEARLRAADGGYRWFIVRSVPLRDAEGGISRWFGAATDIHLQKTIEATLERRVAERTAELHRSNLELDQFAYVASHDLKAPLRGIANLATWIQEDVGETLPAESRRHLSLLRGRVERMERLLDDLLAYSRIGRVEAEPERVDPVDVVRDVVELLAPPPGFEVRVAGPMPAIVTARAPFEGVLRNLIHNAIKHHHRERGTIVVSAADAADGRVAFAVADDGPGIAPEYHERIFRLFQTLRPRDEVEGSGMGLAYVKKAVEAAGGTVRVESEPGRGATFWFTWPAVPLSP